jgi:DNA adenine methylase
MAKLLAPIKLYGAKSYQLKEIIPRIAPAKTYIEGFLGTGVITLNKPKSENEIAIDLDEDIINFYTQLKTPEFMDSIRGISYNRETFEWARDLVPTSLTEKAVKFLVLNRMTFDGLGEHFAWSDRLRGGRPEQINSWENMKVRLPKIIERIKDINFVNMSFMSVLEIYNTYSDDPDVSIYCDPPYCSETRVTKDVYKHEMTHEDHVKLLSLIKRIKGKVLISGYACNLYETELADWNRVEYGKSVRMGNKQVKNQRVEVLWANYKI